MTIDWTKPVETLDGEPVRVLATDRPHGLYPIVVMYDGGTVDTLTQDGQDFDDGTVIVRNAPERRFGYLNVYTDRAGRVHLTRETADNNAGPGRIACVRIEYTAGQFDD